MSRGWGVGQKALVFRGLAVLMGSGVHITQGLTSLSKQAEDAVIGEALLRLAGRLSQGYPLHQAMDVEKVFSPLELGLIRVGERSGSLHTILTRLADLCEKRHALRQKIISAMVYPSFVLTLCLVLLVFAPVFVFSDLLELLRQLDTPLPLVTRLYLGFSDVVFAPATYIFLMVLGMLIGRLAKGASEDPRFARRLEEGLLSVPALGPALRNAAAAEVAQGLGVAYAAGVPILQAMTLSREITWSRLFQERLIEAEAELKNGRSLAEALKGTGFFSGISLTLLSGGEEVGLVAEALESVEKMTREATEQSLETMQKLAEPLILFVIGSLVGFIAIATLAPTLQVIQGL